MRVNNSELVTAVFQGVALKSPLEIRYAICRLEASIHGALALGELQELDFPPLHLHLNGKYYRSVFLPKGAIIVGKIHRHEHPTMLWCGHVTVVTEGGGLEEIRGPYRSTSPVGVKRAIYVHEDTIWTVEHEISLTDLDAIEAAVIAPSYTDLGWEDPVVQDKLAFEKAKEQKWLG